MSTHIISTTSLANILSTHQLHVMFYIRRVVVLQQTENVDISEVCDVLY